MFRLTASHRGSISGFPRFFGTSTRANETVHLQRKSAGDVKAAEETQDVTSMDELLKAVKARANPLYHSLMTMRTPVPWSETLLTASTKEATSTASTHADTSYPTQEQLPARNMHDSYSETIFPFGSSPELFEKYTNASGGIRTGKLLEHLDSLAGSISYKHMLGPGVETLGRIQERGFYIVTASVDRLDMLRRIDPTRDLRISGQVIYTGRSSMEVAVRMESMGEQEDTVLLGRFSMVCRDARTNRARDVNPLSITTPEEQTLYAMGQALKTRRQDSKLRSLAVVPPTSAEAGLLHAFYLRHGTAENTAAGAEEKVWMGSTRLDNNNIMFPQERNLHQKIFGGHLMRVAYELGFTNASTFSRGHVRFLSLDGITFAKPVPIGAVLRLSSYILHSTPSPHFLVHVGVRASVVDVPTGREDLTNEFRFTYCRDEKDPAHDESKLTRQVVPKTYQEAMLWLEGKRALDLGAEIRQMRVGGVGTGSGSEGADL